MDEELQHQEEEILFEHHRIECDAGQQPIRVDKFLMDRLANATRNRIQNAIKMGFIKVNDQEIKSNYKVRPDDIISISLPEPPRDDEIVPEDIPLNIIHEDESILIVNKPAGMVVHPAYNNWTGTLVNGLVYYLNNLPQAKGGEIRPGLVHRIDKDTSGLLVIAKTEEAMTHLAKQFFDHSIERKYEALVWGSPDDNGTIEAHIGRSLKDRKVMMAFPDGEFGKHAVTHFRKLEDLHFVSLIECQLETGRTHQIRAHLKHIGHPLFNDVTYGGDKIIKGTVTSKYKQFVKNCFEILPRQALHAKTLGFVHPKSGKQMHFEAPTPSDLSGVIEKWRKYAEVMN